MRLLFLIGEWVTPPLEGILLSPNGVRMGNLDSILTNRYDSYNVKVVYNSFLQR